MSVNQRKERALKIIRKFEGIPPRGLLSSLAGIHRSTLIAWEKKDKKFRDDVEEIVQQKRLELAGKLYKGFDQCIEDGHYPAIRDGLKVIDPETWANLDDPKGSGIELVLVGVRQEVIIE